MKLQLLKSLFCGLIWLLPAALALAAGKHELLERKTESGATIFGYKDTPVLLWTDGKYHVHDPDRPVPRHVTPAT